MDQHRILWDARRSQSPERFSILSSVGAEARADIHAHTCTHMHTYIHTQISSSYDSGDRITSRWFHPNPPEKKKRHHHTVCSLLICSCGRLKHTDTHTQIRQLNSTVYIRYCICMYLYLLFVTMLLAPEHSERRRRWSGVPGHFTGIPLARIQTSCIRREKQLKHNEHWLSKH